ncbi:MAG: GNAT family N-acetyltransferase, partial [Chloroflexota bacterium]
MSFIVRAMAEGDIPQANEIEREAFPTQWPPTSYKRELGGHLNHYYVIYEEGKEAPRRGNHESKDSLLPRLKGLWGGGKPPSVPAFKQYLVGMVGIWHLYDEAHVISIAVRETYRRRGLGELLLITIIEEAIRLGAYVVTLEVRVSNLAAQALYEKYGFEYKGHTGIGFYY